MYKIDRIKYLRVGGKRVDVSGDIRKQLEEDRKRNSISLYVLILNQAWSRLGSQVVGAEICDRNY